MAYNILLATQSISLQKEGVEEDKLQKKWETNLERRKEKARKRGRSLNPLAEIPTKLRQFSLQFIRCLRTNLTCNTLWSHCVPLFQRAMGAYLLFFKDTHDL